MWPGLARHQSFVGAKLERHLPSLFFGARALSSLKVRNVADVHPGGNEVDGLMRQLEHRCLAPKRRLRRYS